MGNLSSRQTRPPNPTDNIDRTNAPPESNETPLSDYDYPGQVGRQHRHRAFFRNLRNLPTVTSDNQLQGATAGTRRPREEDSSEPEEEQTSDGRRSRPRLEQDLLQFIGALLRDPNFHPASSHQASSVAIPLVAPIPEPNTSSAPSQGEANIHSADSPRRNFLHRALDHLRRFGRRFSLSDQASIGPSELSPLLSSFPRIERIENTGNDPETILEDQSAQRTLGNNRFIVTIRVLDSFDSAPDQEATTASSLPTESGSTESTVQPELPTTNPPQVEGQTPNTRMIRFQYVIYFLDRPSSAQLSPEQIRAIESRVQNILALYTEMAALLTTQYGDSYEAFTRLSELLGNVSRGVSLEAIEEQLGRQLFKETGLATGFACSICLMEVGKEEAMRRLPCGHCFHVDCIDTWLQQCNNCPLCRTTPVQKQSEKTDNTSNKSPPPPPAEQAPSSNV
jgi:hypothetical protein